MRSVAFSACDLDNRSGQLAIGEANVQRIAGRDGADRAYDVTGGIEGDRIAAFERRQWADRLQRAAGLNKGGTASLKDMRDGTMKPSLLFP